MDIDPYDTVFNNCLLVIEVSECRDNGFALLNKSYNIQKSTNIYGQFLTLYYYQKFDESPQEPGYKKEFSYQLLIVCLINQREKYKDIWSKKIKQNK